MTTYDEAEQLKDFNLDDESGLKEISDAVERWIELWWFVIYSYYK